MLLHPSALRRVGFTALSVLRTSTPVVTRSKHTAKTTSTPSASDDSSGGEEGTSFRPRVSSGELEKKLQDIKFPPINRSKMQDEEILFLAEEAIDIVRDIDQIRGENPRYFEASLFSESKVLSPKNYRAPNELTPEDVEEEERMSNRELAGEEDAEDEEAELGENEEGESLDGEEEESLSDTLRELLAEKELGLLDSMGNKKFLNPNKSRTMTNIESLKSWYNEYKYISDYGRFSLGEQTERFRDLTKAYEMRKGTDTELDSPYEYRSAFTINEIIKVGRHCKVTKGGRIFSFSTLVLVGTGKGTAGFGYGKGMTAADAADRAFRDAERNLVSVPLYRGGLSNGFDIKKRGSFMRLWTSSPGPERNTGSSRLVPHPLIGSIIEAFGFNNASIRTWKRRNWHNMLEGLFESIPNYATHPEDVARRMGLKLKVLGHDERFDKLKPHFM